MKKLRMIMVLTLVMALSILGPIGAFAETYTVETGDVLWKIAKDHDVSLEALVEANGLGDQNLILPGQVLTIPGDQKIKNVIVLIGDGMGFGHMELARLVEYGAQGSLHMQMLDNTAFVTTNAYDNIVTDSAAAGTAIATGTKTNNGAVGVDADGLEVDSMADYFKSMNKSIGIISTNTVYDATPATFGASAESRSDKAEIVRDMLAEGWDVILGGGTKYFGEAKQDGVDYIEKYKEAGYAYVSTLNELNTMDDTDKLLGLFSYDYMNYKADKEENESTEPNLVEMTRAALSVLEKDNDGFFLMSEGARIDHAAHAADGTGIWLETIEFDNTVKLCMDWAADRDDTLIIVTADHQTMAISPSESLNVDALKAIEVSPEYMAMKLEKNEDETLFTLESIKSVFLEYANIELTDEEALDIQNTVSVELYAYKAGWEIGSVIAKEYGVAAMDPELRAAGGTGGHTASWVPLFAHGAGSEIFKGVIDNTDIFDMIVEAME